MIAFWISAVLLMAVALALVLPSLLKSRGSSLTAAESPAQANLSVLRSQLAQLDADFASGSINADQLALAKTEIERRVLEEESAPEAATSHVKSTRTAWALALTIPLVAVGVYGFLGNGLALDPANLSGKVDPQPSAEQFEAMVNSFAARLEALPAGQAPDPKAWEMLARSYAAMQKFPEANKAYKRAVELNPGNAQILADYADVMAMLQGQSMLGEPSRLIERALALDPNNLKALALAGSAAFEKKDFAKAIQVWEKASQSAPPDSDFAKGLASSLKEARAASGISGPPSPALASGTDQGVAKSAPTQAAASASIEGVVSLAPELKGKVAPDDTVFIFARAAQGPRMPLAIVRRKASELPITFTLDDSTAMADELKLSKFGLVVVGARISKSGNAMPQSGDFFGQSAAIKPGETKLNLSIDSVQP